MAIWALRAMVMAVGFFLSTGSRQEVAEGNNFPIEISDSTNFSQPNLLLSLFSKFEELLEEQEKDLNTPQVTEKQENSIFKLNEDIKNLYKKITEETADTKDELVINMKKPTKTLSKNHGKKNGTWKETGQNPTKEKDKESMGATYKELIANHMDKTINKKHGKPKNYLHKENLTEAITKKHHQIDEVLNTDQKKKDEVIKGVNGTLKNVKEEGIKKEEKGDEGRNGKLRNIHKVLLIFFILINFFAFRRCYDVCMDLRESMTQASIFPEEQSRTRMWDLYGDYYFASGESIFNSPKPWTAFGSSMRQ